MPDEIDASSFYIGQRLKQNNDVVKYRESDVNEEDVRAGIVPLDDQERCGTCAYWRFGLCQLVEGAIDAFFTCDLFEFPVRTFNQQEEKSMATTTRDEVFAVIQQMAGKLVESGAAANLTIAINAFLDTPTGAAWAEFHKKLSDLPYDSMLAGQAEKQLERREFTELAPPPLPIPESETRNTPYKFLVRVASELRENDPTLSPVDALEKAKALHPEATEAHAEHMRFEATGLSLADSSPFGVFLDEHGVTPYELIQVKARELVDDGVCRSFGEALEEVCRRRPELREAHSRAMRM